MLYRPNYCSNCGEKIDHAVWHFWTSRRFCDVCVTEFPVFEYGPKAVLALSLLVAIGGIGSYFGAGNSLNDRTPERRFERTSLAAIQPKASQPVIANQTAVPERPVVASPITPVQQPVVTKTAAVEQQFYCGAATKKGTPCSRKVKGNLRCFQHQGMPAMVSADKLKLS